MIEKFSSVRSWLPQADALGHGTNRIDNILHRLDVQAFSNEGSSIRQLLLP